MELTTIPVWVIIVFGLCVLYCLWRLLKNLNRDLEPIVRGAVRKLLVLYLQEDEKRFFQYCRKYPKFGKEHKRGGKWSW